MRSSSAGRTALFALFLTLGGAGARAADGALCDDGDACNGVETYDAATGTCVAGAAPDCDDGDFCNGAEGCDPETGACVAGVPPSCDSLPDGAEKRSIPRARSDRP